MYREMNTSIKILKLCKCVASMLLIAAPVFTQNPPLSCDLILQMLLDKKRVPDFNRRVAGILQLIEEYRVLPSLTPEQERRLRDARAPDRLIEDIKSAAIDCEVRMHYESFEGKTYAKFALSSKYQIHCPQVKALRVKRAWTVRKVKWEQSDWDGFERFVKQMGKSGCETVEKCFSGSANSLREEEDMLNVFFSENATFPYYLWAYYAHKKQLPFSFVTEVMRVPFSDSQLSEQKRQRAQLVEKGGEAAGRVFDARVLDLRNSINGNYPVDRYSIPGLSKQDVDFRDVAMLLNAKVHSGFFRMMSQYSGGIIETDFFSPKISSETITAGAIVYKPESGLVSIVYDVTEDGQIRLFGVDDSGKIVRGMFDATFKLLPAYLGGNFKHFRPIAVVNPRINKGELETGKVYVAADSQIPAFSLEQYEGNFGPGIFKIKEADQPMDFHHWIRLKISR